MSVVMFILSALNIIAPSSMNLVPSSMNLAPSSMNLAPEPSSFCAIPSFDCNHPGLTTTIRPNYCLSQNCSLLYSFPPGPTSVKVNYNYTTLVAQDFFQRNKLIASCEPAYSCDKTIWLHPNYKLYTNITTGLIDAESERDADDADGAIGSQDADDAEGSQDAEGSEDADDAEGEIDAEGADNSYNNTHHLVFNFL